MPTTLWSNLTGANCQVGGEPIISLAAQETIDAEYDVASAVTLYDGSPHAKGAVVETVEGGVSTGYWEVDDSVRLQSGKQTWRSRDGAAFAHLPLATYRLKRWGYNVCRASICKANWGGAAWPPRYWSETFWQAMWIKYYYEQPPPVQVAAIVGDPSVIVDSLAGRFGLSVDLSGVNMTAMPDEYIPIGKTLMAAMREIAAWNGASVRLTRNGVLKFYYFPSVFGSAGGGGASLPIVWERTRHDGQLPLTHVNVVGQTKTWEQVRSYFTPTVPPVLMTPQPPMMVRATPVDVTVSLPYGSGTYPVEERIEINSYSIDSSLAAKIGIERLCRASLGTNTTVVSGPGEGTQAFAPVAHKIFGVSRNLDWNGDGYRYTTEVTYPGAWGGASTVENVTPIPQSGDEDWQRFGPRDPGGIGGNYGEPPPPGFDYSRPPDQQGVGGIPLPDARRPFG